jgi:hypothetical protein
MLFVFEVLDDFTLFRREAGRTDCFYTWSPTSLSSSPLPVLTYTSTSANDISTVYFFPLKYILLHAMPSTPYQSYRHPSASRGRVKCTQDPCNYTLCPSQLRQSPLLFLTRYPLRPRGSTLEPCPVKRIFLCCTLGPIGEVSLPGPGRWGLGGIGTSSYGPYRCL